MAKKSDPKGGQRSHARHGGELATGGALALLIVSFVPEGVLDAFQTNLMGIVLTGGFSSLTKALSGGGFGKLLKAIGIGSIVLTMGCGVSLGRVTPMDFSGPDGETIISCELTGFHLGVFDGGVCRNVEGGQVGETFVDLTTGLVEAAGKILGALLSPFGAASANLTALSED